MTELYSKGIDEHYLTRLLSAGTLGVKRTLVPTRWSITAVDDTVGKRLLDEVRLHDTIGNRIYVGSHLGNHFFVMLFDDMFSYELFETYFKKQSYTTDYEPFSGRTSYAEQCAGGYYAARLPVLEELDRLGKQASVLVVRIITDDYYAPLGVWVVREAVRNAMRSTPIEFGDKQLMLAYAKKLAMKRFSYDISHLLAASKLLKTVGVQRRLGMY
jgi:hypothetical protein